MALLDTTKYYGKNQVKACCFWINMEVFYLGYQYYCGQIREEQINQMKGENSFSHKTRTRYRDDVDTITNKAAGYYIANKKSSPLSIKRQK